VIGRGEKSFTSETHTLSLPQAPDRSTIMRSLRYSTQALSLSHFDEGVYIRRHFGGVHARHATDKDKHKSVSSHINSTIREKDQGTFVLLFAYAH
jgi:hypothetical protein